MYRDSELAAERGDAYVEKALKVMVDEVHDPRLSTIMGLVILSKYFTESLRE